MRVYKLSGSTRQRPAVLPWGGSAALPRRLFRFFLSERSRHDDGCTLQDGSASSKDMPSLPRPSRGARNHPQ